MAKKEPKHYEPFEIHRTSSLFKFAVVGFILYVIFTDMGIDLKKIGDGFSKPSSEKERGIFTQPISSEKEPPTSTLPVFEVAILQRGSGQSVRCGEKANVHYTMLLPDGTVIGNTAQKGGAVSFTIGEGEVMRGLERGVEGMQLGEIRQITIPPHMVDDLPVFTLADFAPDITFLLKVELLSFAPNTRPQSATYCRWQTVWDE